MRTTTGVGRKCVEQQAWEKHADCSEGRGRRNFWRGGVAAAVSAYPVHTTSLAHQGRKKRTTNPASLFESDHFLSSVEPTHCRSPPRSKVRPRRASWGHVVLSDSRPSASDRIPLQENDGLHQCAPTSEPLLVYYFIVSIHPRQIQVASQIRDSAESLTLPRVMDLSIPGFYHSSHRCFAFNRGLRTALCVT
jgi:hypothetical protein